MFDYALESYSGLLTPGGDGTLWKLERGDRPQLYVDSAQNFDIDPAVSLHHPVMCHSLFPNHLLLVI